MHWSLFIIIVIDLFLIISAFSLHTKNMLSAFLFKFIPFLFGTYLLIYSFVEMGWVIKVVK